MRRHNCIKYIFVHTEMFRNSTTKISKAYAGPVEDAVKDILRNYLKSKKPLHFELTATNAKYVIPNLKPYDAINFFGNTSTIKEV